MKNLEVIQRTLLVDDISIDRAMVKERIVRARALRYAVPYEVSDNGGRSFYHEVWRAGVFARSISERGERGRIPTHWHHQRQEKPYGAVVGMEDSASEFIFRARIVNGDRGDEMLELIEIGAVNGVSVGARPIVNRSFGGGLERVEAALLEISFTSHAQIADGEILAVRAVMTDDETDTETDEEAGEETPPVETPELDAARQYLSTLERP
jgi:HK97 family phage prohead protease